MTVKELKEKLNQFDDNYIVLVPNRKLYSHYFVPRFVIATSITEDVSEGVGYILIDNYAKEDEI